MTGTAHRRVHWPPHLFLVAGAASTPIPAAGPRLMGNKGHLLARMVELGLRVPEAVVLGTPYARCVGRALSDLFVHGLPALEAAVGRRFGDPLRPLLVSVRSGAPVSMPGMMETVLNVGLCDRTVNGLIAETGHPRLAWDAYRRLVSGYGEVVAGLSADVFEGVTADFTRGTDVEGLDHADLRELTRRLLHAYRDASGHDFPQEPADQLRHAIAAVFRSWDAPKARDYRALHGIDAGLGTAVTVQRMVSTSPRFQ